MREELKALYEEVLCREPDPFNYDKYIRELGRGTVTVNSLRDDFLHSFEYRKIVQPIRELIEKTYDSLLFRRPTKQEIMNHMAQGRGGCGSDEKTRRAVRSGSILAYLNIRPINAELDITSTCNIRCTMCFFQLPAVNGRKRADMPIEAFRRIASQLFPYASRLCLSFSTEPLLNRDLPELVSIAMEYRIPNIHLSTNGVLLTEKVSKALVQSGLHALNISLDAAREETFERLRKGARFRQVIGHIEKFNRIKEQHRSNSPRLSCSFVMMRSNIEELPEFIDLAHRMLAQDVHIMHMVPFSEMIQGRESLIDDRALCNRMLGRARARAAELDMTIFDPGDFPLNDKPAHEGKSLRCRIEDSAMKRFGLQLNREDLDRGCCPFPWHFIAIGPYSEVRPCGWWASKNYMGKIQSKSFEEIWKGPEWTRLRRDLIEGKLPDNCKICPSAGMGDITDRESFSIHRLW